MDEKTVPVKGGLGEAKTCHDCGAKPGELHQLGCDVERCRLCGGQAISCACVYRGRDDEDESEPTDAACAAHDARVTAAGGRLPWTGEFPGTAECREYGLWTRFVEGRRMKCNQDDLAAGPDLNALNPWGGFLWQPTKGKWVRS